MEVNGTGEPHVKHRLGATHREPFSVTRCSTRRNAGAAAAANELKMLIAAPNIDRWLLVVDRPLIS